MNFCFTWTSNWTPSSTPHEPPLESIFICNLLEYLGLLAELSTLQKGKYLHKINREIWNTSRNSRHGFTLNRFSGYRSGFKKKQGRSDLYSMQLKVKLKNKKIKINPLIVRWKIISSQTLSLKGRQGEKEAEMKNH